METNAEKLGARLIDVEKAYFLNLPDVTKYDISHSRYQIAASNMAGLIPELEAINQRASKLLEEGSGNISERVKNRLQTSATLSEHFMGKIRRAIAGV